MASAERIAGIMGNWNVLFTRYWPEQTPVRAVMNIWGLRTKTAGYRRQSGPVAGHDYWYGGGFWGKS